MEFGEIMCEKYGKIVDELKVEGLINNIEHSIARDLVFDLTENNHHISSENNVVAEYFEDVSAFVIRLHEAYVEIKKIYPDLEQWSEYVINDYTMGWAIDYLEY